MPLQSRSGSGSPLGHPTQLRPPQTQSPTFDRCRGAVIVLGLLGLAWGGFTYTTREKVIDIGPIHATRDETHNVPLPPIAGAAALIGGIVLLVAGRKE